MLTLILPFLRANWRIVAAVLILTSAYAFARHQGAESIRKGDEKRAAHAVAKAAVVTGKLADSAAKAGTEAEAANTRIVYRTRTVIERIPREIPRDRDVLLPRSFSLLYDASLGLPEGPGAAAKPESPAAGLYAADALTTIVGNNGSCAWYAENYPRLLALDLEMRAALNGFRP